MRTVPISTALVALTTNVVPLLRGFAQAPFSAQSTCVALQVGQWSGPFPSGAPTLHQPPPMIRFDIATIDSARTAAGYRRLRPNLAAFGALGRQRWEPAWRTVGPHDIEAVWSNGFAGVRLRLRMSGDSLRGVAQAFHDVGGVIQPTAPVTGARIQCPAAPAG
jgi:hypothetical protein